MTPKTALGPDWLWLTDGSSPDVVWIAHRRTGLLLSTTHDMLNTLPQHEADAIAGSLRAAVLEGRHGEVSVVLSRLKGGIDRVQVTGGASTRPPRNG